MRFPACTAFLFGLALGFTPANAQLADELEEPKDKTLGMMFGAYAGVVPGFSVIGKASEAGFRADIGSGRALGLQLGYNFRPWLGVFANLDRSDHSSENSLSETGYSLHHIEVAARFLYHVPRKEKLVVHGNLGVGVRQLHSKRARIDTLTGRLTLSAREVSAGGGVHYFLWRNFALDGNTQFGFGHFSKASAGGGRRKIRTEDVVSVRLRAGVVWYPFDF